MCVCVCVCVFVCVLITSLNYIVVFLLLKKSYRNKYEVIFIIDGHIYLIFVSKAIAEVHYGC